ncbi:MAG: hypothetical protein IKD69_04755, partial [Solobacterium sp.]|nr:hypothetical protein [Solobacterium sp.]
MAGIAAAYAGLPEPSDRFLCRQVAPAVRNRAFIAQFIQNDGFVILADPFIGQFSPLVQVDALGADMGEVCLGMIEERLAVMDGTRMLPGILLLQQSAQTVPVGFRLLLHQIIFIG